MNSLPKTKGSTMAGPRERSRNRSAGRQDGHEMQNLRTSHHSPTARSSNADDEDEISYDDHNHGHPPETGAQLLVGTFLRTCKEWLARALRTCKGRSAALLRMCKEELAKPRMTTIFKASTISIVFVFAIWAAFYGVSHSAEPFDYGLAMGHLRHHQSTITITHSSTAYITYTVQYHQFYGARPVHHQAPMVVPPDLDATGQVTGQDLSHPHVVTATSSPVLGLYLVPMFVTGGGWPQTQQDFEPSSRSASNTDGSHTLQGSPSLGNSEPEATLLLKSHEIGAPRNLVAGQADADTTSFTRWRVEVLYKLRRRIHHSFSFYKEWCITNACSPHKQLNFMCNTTKTISGSFRKQECEWCWPENQRKQQEIDSHCTEVSKRALDAMFIICGIISFCTLVIAILLATRILRRRRRAKAERILHKHVTTASQLQEKTNSVPSHWFSHRMSRFDKFDTAIKKPSPGVTIGQTPWYGSVFAKSGKPLEIGPDDPAPSRLSNQKQRTRPLDQEIANGDENSQGKVPVLPPASPAISSRIFSDIENMGQGSLLSSPGTNNSQHDAQEMPRRSSRRSRAVSTSSEQSFPGATHRRDAGARFYNLQRLTERS